MISDPIRMTIRFAILQDRDELDLWQEQCIAEILAMPETCLVARVTLEDCSEVLDHDLHFILSFSEAVLPSNLLNRVRFGIWRFFFGDWTRYRGKPAGFWEVFEGTDTAPR
jgi:hypothetical protein